MIYLIRHAQSSANAGGRTKFTAETPLSEKGIKQAEEVVSKIGKKPDLIVVSPYIRTRETAQPLISKYPDIPVEEWNVQEFTYLGYVSYNGTTEKDREKWNLDYFNRNDPDYIREEGAESFNQMMARVDNLIEKARNYKDKGKFVVIYTHGRFMKAVNMRLQNIEPSIENLLKMPAVNNTEILEI